MFFLCHIFCKWAMKFIDLSGDSEFESRLEWAKYLRILSKHYADALKHDTFKVLMHSECLK